MDTELREKVWLKISDLQSQTWDHAVHEPDDLGDKLGAEVNYTTDAIMALIDRPAPVVDEQAIDDALNELACIGWSDSAMEPNEVAVAKAKDAILSAVNAVSEARVAELESQLAAPRPYISRFAAAEVAEIMSSIRAQEGGK